jgi:prolipoprotein diacylglyceryltransferase
MSEPWGLRPILFEIGDISVMSYPFFVTLAMFVGFGIYMAQIKKDQVRNMNAFAIVIFALIGGAIGAKLPLLFIYWKELTVDGLNPAIIFAGRSIVGGLLGGLLGAKLVKKSLKIDVRLGNQIAIPVAFAMAIGRIACLLEGCCYGKPTNSSYGIDFGDHILRHPTQLYELVFDVILGIYLIYRKKKGIEPGGLFRLFINSYLGFRFFNEFIRVEVVGWLGLTDFQWICMISLIFINRTTIIRLLMKPFNKLLSREQI